MKTSSCYPCSRFSRRGSALLIVLGMMSFMVVSSVAFSMFMRQSRLPSSFLRQRLTASQLVKAGLAGAMQRLDAGIGDNPYPGVGEAGTRSVEFKKKNGSREYVQYGNFWHNRVFLESRMAKDSSLDGDDVELEFDPVSTLTLEALAYIPPSLVNTVRYWSKRTSTASWQSLGYDAGRYAFTAVNVSDYFDINRIRANVMRDSSPANRISIGYLFENTDHTGFGAVKPADFDTFIGKVTNDVFRTRLVSVADYNIALASGSYGNVGFRSPFWEYLLKKGGGDGTFYGGTADEAMSQKFVTDSWFPGIMDGDTEEVYLTDNDEGQPFDGIRQSLDKLTDEGAGNKAFDIIKRRLDICSLGALYDYVDEDDVPISLAIPTIERAPMLTGISIDAVGVEVKLKQDKKELDPQPMGKGKVERTLFTSSIDSLGDDPKITFSGCGVFPFKRTSGLNQRTSYKVQVYARVFFSDDDKFGETTRCKGGVSYRPENANWKSETAFMGADKAYVNLVGEGTATLQNAAPTTEEGTVFDISEISMEIPANALAGAHVYGVEKMTTYDEYNNPVKTECKYNSDEMSKPLLYRSGKEIKNVKTLGQKGPKLYLCCACRVRIIGDEDRTVDMVPAMISEDKDYTGHDSGSGMDSYYAKICGDSEPLLPICSKDAVMTFDDFGVFEQAAKTETPAAQPNGVDLGSLSIYCDDPRFNYAPEDWYKAEGQGGVRGSTWLTEAQNRCQGGDRRPYDIFQFVSNCGYLQSMGELQFLPYIRSFAKQSNPFEGTFFSASKYDGKWRTKGNLANNQFAWQTHWAFGNRSDRTKDGEDADFDTWGISDTNGGAAVSPYADKDLMMAAIANTPYDWIVASEDNGYTLDNGRRYTFGPGSSEARVDWEELKKVAEGIKSTIGTSKDWEDKLQRSAQWDDDSGPFGADFGNNFHDVDRKFLYSYWRSCFANRQQLFLIFVRAEPAVMGGSSAGHTPSQLGARAVALVWREPVSTISDQTSESGTTTYPHRMRILFYHQFD